VTSLPPNTDQMMARCKTEWPSTMLGPMGHFSAEWQFDDGLYVEATLDDDGSVKWMSELAGAFEHWHSTYAHFREIISDAALTQ
jgi:hypothetical protein